MGILNPHSSMVFHDPESRDHNNYKIMANTKEKHDLINKYLAEYGGKIIPTVNIHSGEVRNMEFRLDPVGRPTRRARTQVVHLCFGDWRKASPEDIERQDRKDKIEYDRLARIEAARAAQKAGLMFDSLSKSADTINRYNELHKSHPDTESELQAKIAEMQKQLKVLKAEKQPNV